MTTARKSRKSRDHRMHRPLRLCRAAAGTGTDNTVIGHGHSETRLTQSATSAGGLFGNDTEAFTLDAVGKRIAHSRVAGAWVCDANNRLTKIGNRTCGQGAICNAAGGARSQGGPLQNAINSISPAKQPSHGLTPIR